MKRKLNCIMLIDDDEDDNFFHRIIASEADISNHVQIAENGLEALNMLQNSKDTPDLIFLDINMPKMNGWEFMEEYARLNLNRDSKTVVVMLTTSLNPTDLEKSKTIPHIAEFKTKPLDNETLMEIYNRYFTNGEAI